MKFNFSKDYIVVFFLVLLLSIFVYVLRESDNDDKLNQNTVDSINWEKTYDSKSKHPFGTYMIHALFEKGLKYHSVYDINVSINAYFDSTFLQVKSDSVTYFFVGKSLNLYKNEVRNLLSFVEKGNTMFVAAEFLPKLLLDKLFQNSKEYNYFGYTNDTSVALTFEDTRFGDNFEMVNQVKGKSQIRRWYNMNYGIKYGLKARTIGKSGNRPCYVEFEYGKGKILIHTIPQVFTNSCLSTQSGREYAEIILSYFSNNTILFDNYTRYSYDDGTMEIDKPGSSFNKNNGSDLGEFKTLDFLLTNQPLRWAYCIILVGIMFFIVFTAKRQQKIMPTLSSNDNSSLEFTETIARLYLKQNQHNKLIVHMENIFKNKIKSKYYIAYAEESIYVKKIAQKSGVEEVEIQHIINLFKGVSKLTHVSDEYLVNLYKKLNNFYQKAK